jgi:hypothetical protein
MLPSATQGLRNATTHLFVRGVCTPWGTQHVNIFALPCPICSQGTSQIVPQLAEQNSAQSKFQTPRNLLTLRPLNRATRTSLPSTFARSAHSEAKPSAWARCVRQNVPHSHSLFLFHAASPLLWRYISALRLVLLLSKHRDSCRGWLTDTLLCPAAWYSCLWRMGFLRSLFSHRLPWHSPHACRGSARCAGGSHAPPLHTTAAKVIRPQ